MKRFNKAHLDSMAKIKKSRRSVVAVFISVVMILATLSMTVTALPDNLVAVNSGGYLYYTDSDGIMAFRYTNYGFDLRGCFNGQWKQTTYNNGGYHIYLRQNGSAVNIPGKAPEAGGYAVGGLNVTLDFEFTNQGKTLRIVYKVTNTTDSAKTFDLGTSADIKIGSDDSAIITPFDDGSGFKMVSDNVSDRNSNGEYAQFNFFAIGYKGGVDVSDFWYGNYGTWSYNIPAVTFYGTNSRQSTTSDSAAAWHWADQTVEAGQSKEFAVLIGIGGAESEDAAETVVHNHNYVYTASGRAITETCSCGHSESATLVIPEGAFGYDGTAKDIASITYSDGWLGGELQITYTNNVAPGQAGVSISKGDVSASGEFTISKNAPIVTPPTAKIGLVYGADAIVLINAGTVADATMEYALGADSTTAPTEGWSTELPTGTDAGTYYVWYKAVEGDTTLGTDPACITVTIAKADQDAPNVDKTNETVSGKADGTITSLTSSMEYRKDGENTYTAVSGDSLTDLAAGVYYVRFAGDGNHNPSPDTEVVISSDSSLTVKFIIDGVVVDTQTVGYGESVTAPTIPEKEGYDLVAPYWNKAYTSITEDTEITAVYAVNEYTITFMDENGVFTTLTYNHGDEVEMPEAPEKEGYMVEWDVTVDVATGNVTVNAVYTEIPQTDDGSIWLVVCFVGALTAVVALNELKRKKNVR